MTIEEIIQYMESELKDKCVGDCEAYRGFYEECDKCKDAIFYE